MSRKKTLPNKQPNQLRNTRRAPRKKGFSLPFRYRFLMIACAVCLLAGFFFAARQHFSSIDFSIKNSRLRKMSEELESDKRRLLLSKEVALSPTEIKKAAQKIGFKVMNASGVVSSRPAPVKPEKTPAEKPNAAKPKLAVAVKTAETAAPEKTSTKKVAEEKAAAVKIKKETAQPTK